MQYLYRRYKPMTTTTMLQLFLCGCIEKAMFVFLLNCYLLLSTSFYRFLLSKFQPSPRQGPWPSQHESKRLHQTGRTSCQVLQTERSLLPLQQVPGWGPQSTRYQVAAKAPSVLGSHRSCLPVDRCFMSIPVTTTQQTLLVK